MQNLREAGLTTYQACEEIGYVPAAGFDSKPEKDQWSMIRAKQIEYAKRDAIGVLAGFVESDIFDSIPAEYQDAIRTLAVKRTGGGGGLNTRNIFMDTIKSFLTEKGDGVDELDLFKELKMGRGEIRAKIRENLKKATPADRFWVELDEDAEQWVLIGTGAKQPKGWNGAPLED